MGKASRVKGHSFERKIANRLKELYPEAKRGFQTRGGGKEQADIEGTPFHVECCHGKTVNIRKKYEQAVRDTDGRPIAVITKRDREDVLVTMEFEDWLVLLRT